MRKITQSGYSSELANHTLDSNKEIYLLSTELEPQYRFENNHRTDEIVAYRAWFTQEGLPPFTVKFAKKIALPSYLSAVNFDNLEACEVRYNIYFRADEVHEVKS
ncbi:Uncharacterised protein [Streptococcus constellatus]|uniref:SuB0782 undefined product 764400:764714 forward MW:11955 n=2 Tax=Streptococcus constellatus TaxID=76860 RepID=A0A564SDL6_STRCV|nr:hypothetical protein [Streptococcus constellatus]VUW93159.1 Uncharacterised protein [Streptococcus constellatus]VUX11295.1 Uncharacterised protein [Streptococcus gordonii]